MTDTAPMGLVLTPEQEESLRASFFRSRIFEAVIAERARQDEKWGAATNRGLALTTWAVVLGEEVGEVVGEIEPALQLALLSLRLAKANGRADQAILKQQREELRRECVQVAAVAVAILECLDDAPWGFDEKDAG